MARVRACRPRSSVDSRLSNARSNRHETTTEQDQQTTTERNEEPTAEQVQETTAEQVKEYINALMAAWQLRRMTARARGTAAQNTVVQNTASQSTAGQSTARDGQASTETAARETAQIDLSRTAVLQAAQASQHLELPSSVCTSLDDDSLFDFSGYATDLETSPQPRRRRSRSKSPARRQAQAHAPPTRKRHDEPYEPYNPPDGNMPRQQQGMSTVVHTPHATTQPAISIQEPTPPSARIGRHRGQWRLLHDRALSAADAPGGIHDPYGQHWYLTADPQLRCTLDSLNVAPPDLSTSEEEFSDEGDLDLDQPVIRSADAHDLQGLHHNYAAPIPVEFRGGLARREDSLHGPLDILRNDGTPKVCISARQAWLEGAPREVVVSSRPRKDQDPFTVRLFDIEPNLAAVIVDAFVRDVQQAAPGFVEPLRRLLRLSTAEKVWVLGDPGGAFADSLEHGRAVSLEAVQRSWGSKARTFLAERSVPEKLLMRGCKWWHALEGLGVEEGAR